MQEAAPLPWCALKSTCTSHPRVSLAQPGVLSASPPTPFHPDAVASPLILPFGCLPGEVWVGMEMTPI